VDTLDRLLNLWDVERAAAAALDPMAWRYFSGGSGDERTLRENRLAFERRPLRPRVLVDVGRRSLATTVLGRPTSWPVLVAPMAFQGLACGEAEGATARAAAGLDTVFCVSTMANLPLERVRAAAPDARQWFQLYIQRDRGTTAELVWRASAAGYEALMVTVDTPVLGRREADLRHGFSLPAHLTPGNLDPRDATLLADGADIRSALAAQFAASTDPSVTWRDLGWLRSAPCRSCSRECSARTTPAARPTRASRRSWSPITAAGSSTGPSLPSTRCRLWRKRRATGSRCCWTAASDEAPTC
jgi:isopentenyl diphosphate isomerase/L-lactate dehydrogenase-like FMN-dependent dehydrogenase